MSIEAANLEKSKAAVVFIAHPDDEERATAATTQLIRSGWDVSFVLWTNGEGGELNGIRHNSARFSNLVGNVRLREFYKSMQHFGVRDYKFMNQPDGGLKPSSRLVDATANIIIDKKARLVMTTTEEKGDSAHPDHYNSLLIVSKALERVSGVQRVEYAAGIDMMETLRSPDHLVDATAQQESINYLLWKVYISQNNKVDGHFFDESLNTRGRLLSKLTGDPAIKIAEAYQRIPGYQVLPIGYQIDNSTNSDLLQAHRPPSYKEIQRIQVAA